MIFFLLIVFFKTFWPRWGLVLVMRNESFIIWMMELRPGSFTTYSSTMALRPWSSFLSKSSCTITYYFPYSQVRVALVSSKNITVFAMLIELITIFSLLLNCPLWCIGSMLLAFRKDFQFLIIFVDNFFRITWLYF